MVRRKKINRCKVCKENPTVQYYGKNMIDIFCPSDDRKCYPGCWVTDSNHDKAIDFWNMMYGEKHIKEL